MSVVTDHHSTMPQSFFRAIKQKQNGGLGVRKTNTMSGSLFLRPPLV